MVRSKMKVVILPSRRLQNLNAPLICAVSLPINQPLLLIKVFFYGEGSGGFSASERIARKGNKYRWDNGRIIVLGEPGKSATRLYPSGKVFDDLETGID